MILQQLFISQPSLSAAIHNLALEGKPVDMVITSHICRGNYHFTYFTSGPYEIEKSVINLWRKPTGLPVG